MLRMNAIILNLGLTCVFLRYNPDNKDVSTKDKRKELLQRLRYHLESPPNGNLVEYLFYKDLEATSSGSEKSSDDSCSSCSSTSLMSN